MVFCRSSDLHELDQIKSVLNDHLSTERGSVLLNGLVDYYLDTSSPQAILILCSVREPHDKHLLDKLNECMAKPACRLPTLTLLGHVIRKQPPWMHKITRFPLLTALLKCLKTDSDVVVLITGVLVLITLLPMIPHAGKQHIYDFFDIFGRLSSWSLKNPGHVHGVYLIHLHASVYSLFHRLYGMYPCNFVSYLRSHYSMKENVDTFEEVVKPMLEHVRIHPELVTGTNDYELDPSRWKRFEIHDIVIECAKVSLDPKEASCEEGYSSMPDHVFIHHHPHLRSGLDYTASPYTDFLSSFGSSASTPLSVGRPPLSLSLTQLSGTQSSLCSPHTSFHQNQHCEVYPAGNKVSMWSPSSECGMTTPPTSRGISPANVPELSQSASHAPSRTASTSGGKCLSPAPTLSNEFEHVCSAPNTTNQLKQKPSGEADRGNPEVISKGAAGESVKTMSLTELSDFIKEQNLDSQRMEKERDEDAITEELLKLTEQKHQAAVGGADRSFYSTTETLTGPQEKELLLTASNQSLNKEAQRLDSTPDKSECSAGGGDQQLPWSFRPCFTPIDNLLTGFSSSRSPYGAEEEGGSGLAKYGPFSSPSTFRDPANPVYEPLFELALPRAASLFVGRKTSVALAQRAAGNGGERNASRGEEEGDETAAMSPLEVLDRLIQHGNEAYDKVLKRLPMPNTSVDWTHFGGTTPLDELNTLRSQVLLLHNQLLYERYKREQHAIRNRRLLRRIINATAMEEQNNSMKAQLKLQDVEIQSLQASLAEEQQRYRRLKEDGDTETACLHSQFQQLQQGHNQYLTKAQKLQSELQECQSNMGELESELQKANNEAYNTGHQLTQLSLKLTNSENLQQQMYLLNKQLLLLGETNKLAIQEVQRLGPESSKELRMLQSTMGKEQERLRQSMVQQRQGLEAAQQRIGDLEAQLAKKDHLILEQKKFLEEVKGQTKGQLQASESRYLALRRVTQVLQTEMLQLYSQLDAEMLTTNQSLSESDAIEPSSAPPPGTSRPNGSSSRTVPTAQGSADRGTQAWPPGNGSTLPPGGGAQSTTTVTLNGSLQQPPLLSEMSPTHLAASPLSFSPVDTPLTVGSYPSAKSFLGMHTRELFRNKSESQCDGDEGTQLSSLSQGLVASEESSESTENVQSSPFPPPATGTPPHSHPAPPSQGSAQSALAQEPPPSDSQQLRAHHGQGARPRASAAAAARQRRKDLRIMDYNETQHEHI
ncbi:TSC complex subunit 1a [Coregonus clupeaformis]|uniref:TSC complex subunit 1a n=1 Tax=Coregonus clupeaformis TaxID=59861 RepID=UPI001E1C29F8|nr:TSC complex subunit 1a [Coregonus clupeaformis]